MEKDRMRGERNRNEIRRIEEIVNQSHGESQVRGQGQEIVPNRIGHHRFALVKVRVVWWSVRCGKRNRCCDANEGTVAQENKMGDRNGVSKRLTMTTRQTRSR
jgi:hypothetical protein